MAIEIKTCARCKKLFQYPGYGRRICPVCFKHEEQQFDEVKEYIRENKNASIKQIHEDLNVSPKLIEEFISSGRLVLSASSPITLSCQMCGAEITKGKICDQCNQSLMEANTSNTPSQKSDSPPKSNSGHHGMFTNKR